MKKCNTSFSIYIDSRKICLSALPLLQMYFLVLSLFPDVGTHCYFIASTGAHLHQILIIYTHAWSFSHTQSSLLLINSIAPAANSHVLQRLPFRVSKLTVLQYLCFPNAITSPIITICLVIVPFHVQCYFTPN